MYQQGDMILRKVGDYADSYDATTNKITRRVGVKVLDGTETGWSYSAGNVLKLTFNDKLSGKTTMISSHFKYNSEGSSTSITNEQFGCGTGTSKTVYFRNDTTTSLTMWEQYLAAQYAAGTPVVVYYPLATPVEESMPPRCQ